MPTPNWLQINVKNSRNNLPIEGATITLDGGLKDVTDSNGTAFWFGLTPKSYDVLIVTENFFDFQTSLDFVAETGLFVVYKIDSSISLPEGQIVDVNFPERVWDGQIINQSAIIKNIGIVSGSIFYRLSRPFELRNLVQEVVLEPSEEVEVPIIDFSTGEPFVGGIRGYTLEVWGDSPQIPNIGGEDDSFSWDILLSRAGATIRSIDLPTVAPAQTPLEAQINLSNGASEDQFGTSFFFRMIDKDTGVVYADRQFQFKFAGAVTSFKVDLVMPNRQLNLISESGTVNGFRPETQDFGEVIDSRMANTITVGGAEGVISITEIGFPVKSPQFRNIEITLTWSNFSGIGDDAFARLIDVDNGTSIWDWAGFIQNNTGRFTQPPLVFSMPDHNFNLRFEVGHLEDQNEVVDETKDFSIISFNPLTVNVDTIPEKGLIFVNGAGVGVAPQELLLEPGTYTISFGFVSGFIIPPAQIVTGVGGEVIDILAEYVPGEDTKSFAPLIIGMGLVGAALVVSSKK